MALKVTSKPINMKRVLTNGTDFISLYFRSEKNLDNNEIVDKFYWVKTNASGIFTNERNNALNGYFSSQGAAESNLPSGGYGELSSTDEFQTRREWGIKIDFPFDSGYTAGGNNTSLNQAIVDMKQFIDAGGTYIQNTIQWDDVFLSLSAQNANNNSAWARYDDLFNWVLTYDNKTKLAIRINVTKSGRTHNDMQGSYDPTNNFWPLSKAQKDTTGSVMRVYDDKGCFSFADTSAVSQALDFVTKVKNRYSALFGSRLLWCSVVTTSQDESGYNYENWHRDFPTEGYDAYYRSEVYDYSQLSIESFRTRMNTKYGSISAINAAWGTNFASINAITPPYPPSMDSNSSIDAVYSGNRGNDWYEHNYELLKAFHINCKSIINTACKYTIENGSCSDLVRRLTIDVLDANDYSDMLKAQFHELPGYPDLGLSVDYMRANYTKKIGVELSQLDFAGIYPATGNMYNFITNGGISAIRNGAMDILMIANSLVSSSDYTQVFNGFKYIKSYSESGFTKVIPTRTVTFTIKQILNNFNFLIDTFIQQGGRESRIDMKITNTETPSSTTFSIYPISKYIINDNSIKSNGRYTIVNDHVEYNIPNTFSLLVPTHSIDYYNNPAKAKSNIKIVGSNGVEYISSIQLEKVKGGDPLYSNNHPDREYIRDIVDDAHFILPTSNSYYDITCENTGTDIINFMVFGIYSITGINYSITVNAGSTNTYRLSTNGLANLNWYERQIKINNNRFQ
jgi:hypothetical protein